MFQARPSAIAVLPTPGSPTSNTLFLLLRPKASAIESSSVCLPITGSILPLSTSAFKLVVNERKALVAIPDISSSSYDSTISFCK